MKEIVKRIISNVDRKYVKVALENVYGWDIDKEAIRKCRLCLNKLVKDLGISVEWNISHGNSLDHILHEKFDYIVGNPPYVRIQNLEIDVRDFLKRNYSFCTKGSTDLYIAFFELSTVLLSTNGKCTFITPNSYFVSESAHKLREYFEENNSLIKITNYKDIQLFQNASTYSAITTFGKKRNESFLYEESQNENNFESKYISFKELCGRNFWFLTLSDKFLKIRDGQRLGDICKISVGIATLADWAYIVRIVEVLSKENVKIINKKGQEAIVEKTILMPIIKASKLKASDSKIKEYIIFPYKKNNEKKNVIISENNLIQYFPKAYKYLKSIKHLLDQRDKGKLNPIAWYAFGRTQSMDNSVGEKIIFSPLKKSPNFILTKNPEGLVYSGYYIKFDGDYEWLLSHLNSDDMEEYLDVTGRYFRHGWRGITKKILEDFVLPN